MDRHALAPGTIAHRDVVGAVVEMNLGAGRQNWSSTSKLSAMRFVSGGMSSPTIHMPAVFSRPSSAEVNLRPQPPGAEGGGHERQARVQRLQLAAADEAAQGLVVDHVVDDAGHVGAAPHRRRPVEHAVGPAFWFPRTLSHKSGEGRRARPIPPPRLPLRVHDMRPSRDLRHKAAPCSTLFAQSTPSSLPDAGRATVSRATSERRVADQPLGSVIRLNSG